MINRNPLGIRKLDVQQARREYRRSADMEAARILNSWNPEHDADIISCIAYALQRGWEAGVEVGAQATRERVAESLANGKLVKT